MGTSLKSACVHYYYYIFMWLCYIFDFFSSFCTVKQEKGAWGLTVLLLPSLICGLLNTDLEDV